MSYMALYRKWRPDAFEEVKGQDHIVTTLKNQLIANRIGHAYLFCGTRGTGKTTVAKLFAKAVNCEHPIDGSPCNQCPSCKAISSQSSMNVIEIDAASNNGVENIREIREQVQYSPADGRYKVYIIDEVHMLSTGAFNALLKTLEEPPSYVIFILATTEVHKIPITILSRCQRYDFKRISIDTIAKRLTDLMEKEQIEVEPQAIRYVAKAADGSMRDALSLLDQCIAFYLGKKLTYENVLEVLGATDTEVFSRLIRLILARDIPKVLEMIHDITMEGREMTQFLTDFMWYLRNMLLIKNNGGNEDIFDMSPERLQFLKEEAEMIDEEALIRYIHVASDLLNQMRYSTQKRILLETGMIRMCKPQMEKTQESLIERIKEIEKKLEQGQLVSVQHIATNQPVAQQNAETSIPAGNQTKENPKETLQNQLEQRFSKAEIEDLKTLASQWKGFLKAQLPSTKIMLQAAKVSVSDQSNHLRLLFEHTDAGKMGKGYFEGERNHKYLEMALSQIIKKEVKVDVDYVNEKEQSVNILDFNEERIQRDVGIKVDWED